MPAPALLEKAPAEKPNNSEKIGAVNPASTVESAWMQGIIPSYSYSCNNGIPIACIDA